MDPHAHQIDLEEQVKQRLVGYDRVSLRASIYRDRKGFLWDYTWTALAKDTDWPGPYRAIEETYIARDGVEYAIHMAGPAEDWETTRKQFDTVLQGWQPSGR